MQKRPILLLLFTLSLLYLPAKCVYRFFKVYETPFWHDITDLSAIYHSLYVNPFVASLQFFLPLVIVVGLLMRKKWGYYLLLVFSFAYAIRLAYSIFERFTHVARLGSDRYLLLGAVIIKVFYFLVIIFYFLRPRIRQLFK
jgi:hypothetical protein